MLGTAGDDNARQTASRSTTAAAAEQPPNGRAAGHQTAIPTTAANGGALTLSHGRLVQLTESGHDVRCSHFDWFVAAYLALRHTPRRPEIGCKITARHQACYGAAGPVTNSSMGVATPGTVTLTAEPAGEFDAQRADLRGVDLSPCHPILLISCHNGVPVQM